MQHGRVRATADRLANYRARLGHPSLVTQHAGQQRGEMRVERVECNGAAERLFGLVAFAAPSQQRAELRMVSGGRRVDLQSARDFVERFLDTVRLGEGESERA